MFRAAGLSAPACARPVLLRSRPGAPLGAESLRGRASPFGVPSAALRLAGTVAFENWQTDPGVLIRFASRVQVTAQARNTLPSPAQRPVTPSEQAPKLDTDEN